MQLLDNICIWYISRKQRAKPLYVREREQRERLHDEYILKGLEFGLMGQGYFSSSAAQEARKGPAAVLRNERGEPMTVKLEPALIEDA